MEIIFYQIFYKKNRPELAAIFEYKHYIIALCEMYCLFYPGIACQCACRQ